MAKKFLIEIHCSTYLSMMCYVVPVLLFISPCAVGQGAATQPYAPLLELRSELIARPLVTKSKAQPYVDAWLDSEQDNPALRQFRQRLLALRDLHKRIINTLSRAKKKAVNNLVDDVLIDNISNKSRKDKGTNLIAAEQLYQRYIPYFKNRIDTKPLTKNEKELLKIYYNAEIQVMISDTMKLGQSLAATGEKHPEIGYYLLLAPLLHSPEGHFSAQSLQALPEWVRNKDNMTMLYEFCLYRCDRLDAAFAINRLLCQKSNTSFSPIEFYIQSAKGCNEKKRADLAVICYEKAINQLKTNNPKTIDLKFKICETWAKSGNISLAAGQADQIVKEYPNTQHAGYAKLLRARYLLKNNNTSAVIRRLKEDMNDPFCSDYVEEMLYLNWKAHRKGGDGRIAAKLLKEYLGKYPKNEHGAEMLYSLGVDCLASTRYADSAKILSILAKKYPGTLYAKKASHIIEKINAMNVEGNNKKN